MSRAASNFAIAIARSVLPIAIWLLVTLAFAEAGEGRSAHPAPAPVAQSAIALNP